MKQFLLGIFALAMSITFANAADIYKAHPRQIVASSAPFTWDGVYIGANVGLGMQDTRVDRTSSGFFSGLVPAANDSRPHGALYGGQIGARKQWGALVAGVEVEFDWTNVKANSSSTAALGPFVNSNTLSQKLSWLSTADVVIGFVPLSHWLVYAKGGLAVGKITTDSTTSVASCLLGCGSGSAQKTATGWNLGVGTELALNSKWSVGVEGRYYDLGSVSGTYTTTGFAPTNVAFTSDYRGYDVRAKVNFRF